MAGEASEPPADNDEELVSRVQEILESMLSKKNLARDQFLASNMNPQMYIPIRVLLQHDQLAEAGATDGTVVSAASRSTRLGVDSERTMVRPILKSKRNVIIVRDVPEGTTEEEIRELFAAAPHADRIKEVRPEVNNTWFVKFGTDDVQDVVLWLRSQKLKGQPVNAAIKSEHFLRSFYPINPAPEVAPPEMGGWGMPRPPYGMEFMEMGPPMEFDGGAMDWGAMPPAGAFLGGKGMPLPQVLGPQPPGFWQPWGERHQPPPLIFTSETTLASSSMGLVAEQAAPLAPGILDNVGLPDGGKGKDKGKGKSKGGGWEDRGKDKSGKGGKNSWGAPDDGKDRRKGKKGGSESAGGKTRWAPRVVPEAGKPESEAAKGEGEATLDRELLLFYRETGNGPAKAEPVGAAA